LNISKGMIPCSKGGQRERLFCSLLLTCPFTLSLHREDISIDGM
jgi:hypothetical protein